jgi:hypothetical protein
MWTTLRNALFFIVMLMRAVVGWLWVVRQQSTMMSTVDCFPEEIPMGYPRVGTS